MNPKSMLKEKRGTGVGQERQRGDFAIKARATAASTEPSCFLFARAISLIGIVAKHASLGIVAKGQLAALSWQEISL